MLTGGVGRATSKRLYRSLWSTAHDESAGDKKDAGEEGINGEDSEDDGATTE